MAISRSSPIGSTKNEHVTVTHANMYIYIYIGIYIDMYTYTSPELVPLVVFVGLFGVFIVFHEAGNTCYIFCSGPNSSQVNIYLYIYRYGCGSKVCSQNGALVNGTRD